MADANGAAKNKSLADRRAAIPRDSIVCDARGCHNPGARLRCTRCKDVFYCSKACQKASWKKHKTPCTAMYDRVRTTYGAPDIVAKDLIEKVCKGNSYGPAKNPNCTICWHKDENSCITVVDCGHGFCRKCLVTHQRAQRATLNTGTKPVLPCPHCKSEVHHFEFRELEKIHTLVSHAINLVVKRNMEDANLLNEKALELIEGMLRHSPSPHLRALYIKAAILPMLNRHEEALEVLDQIVQIEIRRFEDHKQDVYYQDEHDFWVEHKFPDDETTDIHLVFWNACDLGFRFSGNLAVTEASRPFGLQLARAEAFMAMGKWREAFTILKKLEKKLTVEVRRAARSKDDRFLFRTRMDLQRCCFELGDKQACLDMSVLVLSFIRYLPDSHKYLALCYKEKGDLESAIQVMMRAAIYETPYDEVHQEETLNFLDELIAESKS